MIEGLQLAAQGMHQALEVMAQQAAEQARVIDAWARVMVRQAADVQKLFEVMVRQAADFQKQAAKAAPIIVRQAVRSFYAEVLEAATTDDLEMLRYLATAIQIPADRAATMGAVAFRWAHSESTGNYMNPRDVIDLRRIWTAATFAYDSDHIEPVRLGGMDVLGLDALPEIVVDIGALLPMRLDFQTTLLGLGFNFEEAAIIEANKIQGMPWRDAGASLGWDETRIARVRRRCARKAEKVVRTRRDVPIGTSGRVKIGDWDVPGALLERVGNGRLIWRTPDQ